MSKFENSEKYKLNKEFSLTKEVGPFVAYLDYSPQSGLSISAYQREEGGQFRLNEKEMDTLYTHLNTFKNFYSLANSWVETSIKVGVNQRTIDNLVDLFE